MPNLPPLELTPDYSTGADSSDGPKIKQATIDFCTELTTALNNAEAALAAENLTVQVYRLDVYDLFTKLTTNANAYGFTDVTSSSQTADGATPDTYLFWDDVHPTTAGHYQLAAQAYTLLTGIPMVEINPKTDNTGFYFTRTGTDLSTKLKVFYNAVGSAVPGVDYDALAGKVKIKPGQQTQELDVTPISSGQASSVLKLKILPETDYVQPVVRHAKIKLN